MSLLSERQRHACESHEWDFSDLRALFLKRTLKPSPAFSHTGLSRAILEANGVSVEVIRPVDHHVAHGVHPDMTDHGWDRDDWPAGRRRTNSREP